MSYLHLVSPLTRVYTLPAPLDLELGGTLPQAQVAYRTWGQLNPRGNNAVLVCHALTGTADLDDWWQPLLGVGRSLDPSRDFIICSNILGSCYGTTGPTSPNPATGQPYGPEFPPITVRDMVRAQAELLTGLGVGSLRLVIGGSLGGMQALEWGCRYSDWVESLVVIAAPGRHSAWCIGLSEAQRQAIYTDPQWQGGYYSADAPPVQGLAVARMVAMSTYRSWTSFQQRFARASVDRGLDGQDDRTPSPYAITDYLQYQGAKLVSRFDANSYIILTQAMDCHDVGGGQPNLGSTPDQRYRRALGQMTQPTLVVAIATDILYPPVEQKELVSLIPRAELSWLQSAHGHDGFLIDMEALNQQVLDFRLKIRPGP